MGKRTIAIWIFFVLVIAAIILLSIKIVAASEADPDIPELVVNSSVVEPNKTDAINAMIKSSRIPTRDIKNYVAAGITDHDMAGSIMTSFKEIDRIVSEDIANGFPGAQICVMKNSKIIYENAWGFTQRYNSYGAPLDSPMPVTTDTLYDIGGSSAPFTAQYAALHLISEGKLQLDTKIVEILGDDFVTKTIDPVTGDVAKVDRWKLNMTIEHLLRHLSGFPVGPSYYYSVYDYGSGERPNPLYNRTGTREETFDLICATPLDYMPAEGYRISDIDDMLLTFVVEKITGEGLDDYLAKIWGSIGADRITFNPLDHGYVVEDCAATELSGNTRFGLVDFPGIRTDVVRGEVHDEAAYYLMEGVSGHAGLFANARSLAKVANTYLHPSGIFSEEVLNEMLTPTPGTVTGIGWWLETNDDGFLKEFWVNGFTHCFISVIPVTDTVIVYLTNSISSPLSFTSEDFAKHDLAHAMFVGNAFRAAKQAFIFGY